MYFALHWIHVTAVGISGCLFLVRGVASLSGMSWQLQGLMRILPHGIDSILLFSAIGLALSIRQFPMTDHWLTAKLIALLFYIGFGMVVMRPGKSLRARAYAFAVAALLYAYIIATALSRSPWLGLV